MSAKPLPVPGNFLFSSGRESTGLFSPRSGHLLPHKQWSESSHFPVLFSLQLCIDDPIVLAFVFLRMKPP